MSWQVNNGPLEPVPQQMLTDLRSACGVNDSAADATTNVAQLALRGSRSGSDSSDAAVHSAGSSGNDSPPTVRGTPPAAQELTQQQMMQLLQQQQQQMQQQQEQMQQMQQQMQQMAAQSGSKPLPQPPATSSSSSSSDPRMNEVLARASQARAAVQAQQARLAPLVASTPASAAASTSIPGAPVAQTQPTSCAPIPASECFTYQGKSYHIPGMTKQVNPTTLSFQLNDGTEETVNVATMCTQPITFKEGFNPSFKIHMLLENKMVPFDTMKALLHPDFVPDHMLDLYNGQSSSLLHDAAIGGIKKILSNTSGYRNGKTSETIVSYLISRGATVDIPIKPPQEHFDCYTPSTPLYCAVNEGNYDVCLDLLNAGANPRGVVKMTLSGEDIKRNKTTLHVAAERGEADIAQLLLKWGLDPDAVDDNGQTPLFCAADKGKENILRLLIEGVDVEGKGKVRADIKKTVKGLPPLQFVAGRYVSVDIVKAMLERGADPTEPVPAFGGVPMGAIIVSAICERNSTGNEAVLRLILNKFKEKYGVVPQSVLSYKYNDSSRLPIENAQLAGRKDLVDTLKEFGAGQNAVVNGATNLAKKGFSLIRGTKKH